MHMHSLEWRYPVAKVVFVRAPKLVAILALHQNLPLMEQPGRYIWVPPGKEYEQFI